MTQSWDPMGFVGCVTPLGSPCSSIKMKATCVHRVSISCGFDGNCNYSVFNPVQQILLKWGREFKKPHTHTQYRTHSSGLFFWENFHSPSSTDLVHSFFILGIDHSLVWAWGCLTPGFRSRLGSCHSILAGCATHTLPQTVRSMYM